MRCRVVRTLFITHALLSVGAYAARAQLRSPQTELLSFRLVADSIRAVRQQSVVEATVEFIVRNRSDTVVYGTNECGRSPMYWVERRELDSLGNERWREVFSADCIGGDFPRLLMPSDSMHFTSPIVAFPGQRPEFVFSNHADVFRVVYVVRISPQPGSRDVRAISPPFVIRAPPEP
jgi:hypothetical protein